MMEHATKNGRQFPKKEFASDKNQPQLYDDSSVEICIYLR